ncbi:hypothetical protein POVWA2_039430 [Plasmodium ovale wallikeri]|uniref:Uncharacterized protein n=1 Tax=Plasmodium ovale wallikeri TaxID=864142 RepID=A0A1A8Z8V4_PLAOA|nr:hypothetical protein POVWA2_039430 [Plasmodium ovale wallikeri]
MGGYFCTAAQPCSFSRMYPLFCAPLPLQVSILQVVKEKSWLPPCVCENDASRAEAPFRKKKKKNHVAANT